MRGKSGNGFAAVKALFVPGLDGGRAGFLRVEFDMSAPQLSGYGVGVGGVASIHPAFAFPAIA